MTNIIGQILIVLAVNVTTNTAEFVRYEASDVLLHEATHSSSVGTGTVWDATTATTNAPVSKQTETRIGCTTKQGKTRYLFSIFKNEPVKNDLGKGWFYTPLYCTGFSGLDVESDKE